MPVASLPEIMDRAFKHRYGVAAFNTVDDITMDGVISAAEQSSSPFIVQISVKTVKFWGADVVKHMFTHMANRASVPVTLHLDHCPDPEFAKTCLKVGWNSVLFDGSGMSFDDNFKLTREIVEFAKQFGAASRAKSWRSPASKTAWAARGGRAAADREGAGVHQGHRHLLLRATDWHGTRLLQSRADDPL